MVVTFPVTISHAKLDYKQASPEGIGNTISTQTPFETGGGPQLMGCKELSVNVPYYSTMLVAHRAGIGVHA